MKDNHYDSALRVAFIYLIFSALWIFLSDTILLYFLDGIDEYRSFSTLKGFFFIIASSLIIYLLVQKEINTIKLAHQNIQHLEQFDTLTNLSNRFTFNSICTTLNHNNTNVAIIMTDINGLRLINEVYSLSVGDQALINYSNLLKDIFPTNATIARIGGDEFCVILTEPHIQKATEYINRLTSRVNQTSINELPLTVAIGYAENNDDTSIFDTIALAEEHMLKNKLLIHNSSRNSIVTSLQTALFERSDETEQHANRMVEMCYKLGKKLDLQQNELDDLKLFALLHDIGKIGVGDHILKKPGKLTDEEYVLMQQHPLIGYKIANSVEALKGIANNILTHHEWWDGTGYPNQLKQDEIPLLSRILCIVDAWDAMTNDRVYRKAISEEKALQEIIDNKGSQFDPLIADQFIQCIQNKNCI